MTLLITPFDFSTTTMEVDAGLDLCGMARYGVDVHEGSRLCGVSESRVARASQARGEALR